MILPYFKGMKFFALFDQLSIYAHERLTVVDDDEFWTGEPPRGIGEAGQRETMLALWENLDIIDDFIRENPRNLTPADLDIIGSWKHAFSGIFNVERCPDGQLRFYGSDHLFDVCGMSLEIEGMFRRVPTIVQTTLLPFQEFIVYGQTMLEMPIDQGDGMRDVVNREVAEALAEGRIVHTGAELCAIEPKLTQQRIERNLEDFRYDMEMEERAAGPLEGQRASALCGMDDEERDEAIRRHMDELDAARHQGDGLSMHDYFESMCTPGPIVTGLVELIGTEEGLPTSEQILERLGNIEDGPQFDEYDDSPKEADYIKSYFAEQRKLAASVSPAEFIAQSLLSLEGTRAAIRRLQPDQIALLHELALAGGQVRVPEDHPKLTELLPFPERGLCYRFHEGGEYVSVMPDEIVALADQLDWDTMLADARDRRDLISYFDKVVDLRGIVPYVEAVDEYAQTYPDGFPTAQEIHDTLMDAIEDERSNVCMLMTEEEVYLLHYELMSAYAYEHDGNDYDYDPIREDELDDLLKGLLAQQRGKDPRPLTAEMLAEEDLYDWKEKQPCVRAVRDFFDAHVPDGRDEYFFADKVVEDLLDEVQWGMVKGSVQAFWDILEDNGFLPDESQLKPLLALWQNLCNALPVWPNNGWAPNELLSRSTGRKVFYNPDGSVMRVGRNDPCPCGSGKKYKRCHGR